MEATIKTISIDKNKLELYRLWESVLEDTWPVEQQTFTDVIDNQNSINYIAQNKSGIIGFLSSQIVDKKASIVCIFVGKTYQRKGVGTKLVEKLLSHCKEKGLIAFLLVPVGNLIFGQEYRQT